MINIEDVQALYNRMGYYRYIAETDSKQEVLFDLIDKLLWKIEDLEEEVKGLKERGV